VCRTTKVHAHYLDTERYGKVLDLFRETFGCECEIRNRDCDF
jgi:hypothetical protein